MKLKNSNICPICKSRKDPTLPYCNIHMEAKNKLKIAYEKWLYAYGVLSWDEFIKEIMALDDNLGQEIRKLVEYERFFKRD